MGTILCTFTSGDHRDYGRSYGYILARLYNN